MITVQKYFVFKLEKYFNVLMKYFESLLYRVSLTIKIMRNFDNNREVKLNNVQFQLCVLDGFLSGKKPR